MLAPARLICGARLRLPSASQRSSKLVRHHATSQSDRALFRHRISGVNSYMTRSARIRSYASQTSADETIEEIQELYATAKDEFDIAAEETEKMSIYAEDDRAAARSELDKLQDAYRTVVEGQDVQLAEEVRRRVGHRIRELNNAVEALEDLAQHQD